MSYGVNSAMALSYWQFRRDRKMNASEIILRGDKAVNYSDWLTSEDGRYLEGDSWIWSLGHRSRTTNRHANGTRANMLMADGHVAALGRDDLKFAAGHWYFGEPNLPEVPVYVGVCCGQ
jgi:prepilin-type processing-associated H-X9-DG protein